MARSLRDVVIDTNVFAHASNSQETRRHHSNLLLRAMYEADVYLCVDEGFSLEEAINSSKIGQEYLKHLRYGTPGLALVAHLAKNGRVRQVSATIPRAPKKIIMQCITKPRDQTFVKVAYNSASNVLVSHDFEDFQIPKRRHLKKTIGVIFLEAKECLPLLGVEKR